ncbi:MAG: hypothetical protein WC222_04375 [Parachlamydiales bacterium]|jgi:hypothetical protein
MDEETPLILTPVNFFQFAFELHKIDLQPLASLGKRLSHPKYRLPDLSGLCAEEAFAEIYMGWAEQGLAIHVLCNETFNRVSYPDVTRGDSLELFLDTRDVKTSGYNTRYCHHFYCLPESIEGHQAGEITHFRTEDAHEWCNHEDLEVKASKHSGSYSLTLIIPSHCMTGYDPENFNRIGISYRVNRTVGPQQHFSAVSEEFQIEQQPSLWASFKLIP